jgi:Pyruvate/2-oxoacid:ferredoxin oxidoreductase gamma subunit
VVEEGRVKVEESPARVLALPFERLAREELREKVAANMMAVGAVGALVGCLTSSSLVEAGLARSPAAFRVVNRQAIERGWHLVADNTELGGLRAKLAHLGAPVMTEIGEAMPVGTP